MNLLLMANNGLPRNGLVALYDPYRDTYGRNILPVGSENFVTGWTGYNGETITVTDYPTTIDGQAVVAKRIQGAGDGISLSKFTATTPTLSNPHSTVGCIYAKLLSGNATFNISAGTPSTLTTNWAKHIASNVNRAGTTSTLFFNVNAAANILDILIYQPQVNLSTLYPYSPPAGLPQSLTDYTGRGNNAQLGSTAGADTNDPAYSGQGLAFGGDDYCTSSSPVFDDMSAFTCITVCKPLSAGGLSVGRIFDKTGRIFRYENIGVAFYQLRGGAFTQWTTGAVNFGNNVIYSVAYNGASPDTAPIVNINTIKQTLTKSGTGTGGCTSDASADLYIGNRSTADRNFDGTIYLQAWYNRILSDTEYMQAYNYLRRLMMSRGVVI